MFLCWQRKCNIYILEIDYQFKVYIGRLLMLCWSVACFFMIIFYGIDYRTYLIEEVFETNIEQFTSLNDVGLAKRRLFIQDFALGKIIIKLMMNFSVPNVH